MFFRIATIYTQSYEEMIHLFKMHAPHHTVQYLGSTKRKGIFKHAHNAQIQIHPTRKVSSGLLLSIDTVYNGQWFC